MLASRRILLWAMLLTLAAGCSSGAERAWLKVAALPLPNTTFSKISEVLGEFDAKAFAGGKTTYFWYPVSYGRKPAPKNQRNDGEMVEEPEEEPEEWYMLQVTIDHTTGDVMAFERNKPVASEDGSLRPVSLDASYRDEKGEWKSGPAPPEIVPWGFPTHNPRVPERRRVVEP
jgi:hypothetical protein